jgi:thiol-disulfide isomerase/thioredoxin/sugar lactone lactonase YvrE
MPDSPRVHAPEFTGALEWFNVAAPLTLASLRGKVVLLDFWTYGCVNCMHILPDLKRLEERYRDELVVIGIHSAKFANERQSDNIRRIIVRYEIEHPVANDANFAIWKAYGARAWPTQVLIDPEGYVVGAASGEGHAKGFDEAIAAVIQFFDEQKKIDRRPLAMSPERERIRTSTLAFPGKVLADEARGRLFVADSNHHRVLVAGLDGAVTDVIGEGPSADERTSGAGYANGAFEQARFYRPQGLALDRERQRLYIADTENHVVRVADLAARTVGTVAGTGKQGAWGGQGGAALETAISSPWDLALDGRLLFVAMAGTHQIWVVDLERQLAIPYAGSGREARADGSVDEAAFAQPSGLSIADGTLYVADAESNIIRAIALPPKNQVTTLVGGDLFEFGDLDGVGDDVRLQHPLGVVWAGGALFIADTYNHRIKRLEPKTRRVEAFAGAGRSGAADGPAATATFYEPGGISATSSALFVADTNNHAIRRIDLETQVVSTVGVVRLGPPLEGGPSGPPDRRA